MSPTPEAVRLALERVIASAHFCHSNAQARLLRYTVEAALTQPSVALKEYTVAVEALGRPASFDPRTDSIVRVLARKLREKLARYYEHDGLQDAVRFEYSRGSYIPRIETTRPAVVAPARTIAVLPFLNLSAAHDAGYFTDGLTEELMYLLSRTAHLRVVARTSCFRFKGSTKDVREIGRELGAELLVEGGVRLDGDRLRVTARLVSAADGLEVWSDRYARTLDDRLRVQEEIASAIARALRAQAGPPPAAPDVEAHNLYLKGRHFWNQRTEDAFKRALELFEAAVRRDPAMARAYAGIADTHILMMMHGVAEPRTVMPLARSAALKALATDPELAPARSSLAAVLHVWDQDARAAETEWLRAIRTDPAYATAHHWYAVVGLVPQRRFDEAIGVIREAERLDPLSLPIASDAAFVLYWSRRYDEAIEQCRRALALNRSFYRAYIALGRIYAATRQYSQAIEACVTARTLCDGGAFLAQLLGTLGFSYAGAGEIERAHGVLEELRAIAPTNSVAEYEMGIVHAALGQWTDAAACVDAARARRTGWMAFLGVEPLYDRVNARVHV